MIILKPYVYDVMYDSMRTVLRRVCISLVVTLLSRGPSSAGFWLSASSVGRTCDAAPMRKGSASLDRDTLLQIVSLLLLL